jgi:hypothetical protein
VSVAEIIKELPKLRPDERAAVATCLRDIEEQECVEVCNTAAVEGAQLLDAMEQEDAKRPTR